MPPKQIIAQGHESHMDKTHRSCHPQAPAQLQLLCQHAAQKADGRGLKQAVGSWCPWCPITAGYFPFENDLGKGHDGISYLVAHRTSHQASSKDLQRHGGSEPVLHPYSSYF